MIKKIYTNNLILSFLLSFSVILYILSDRPFNNLWILPLAFTFSYFYAFNNLLPNEIGDHILKYAIFIRYVFIPLLLILSGPHNYSFGGDIGLDYYNSAILYMSYELIIVAVIYKKLNRNNFNKGNIKKTNKYTSSEIYLFIIIILLGAFTLIIPEIRNRFSFFSSQIGTTARALISTYDSSFNPLFYIANYARFLFPVVCIVVLGKKYSRKPSYWYVIFAMVCCLLPNLFYTVTSRNSIFIPLLASLYTMILVFDRHRKFVLIMIGAMIVMIIGTITISKSIAQDLGNLGMKWISNYFSIYFMGPKEYAIGIVSIIEHKDSISIVTFINDIIGNIPILSGFSNLIDRTSQYYNWTYYGRNIGIGGGYIIPNAIQGAFYFGFLLGPLTTVIPLLIFYESKKLIYNNRKNIPLVYIAAYAMCSVALFYSNSFSSILNNIFFMVIPMLLIDKLQHLLLRIR